MKTRILFLLAICFSIFLSKTFAYSSENFDITIDGAFQGNKQISVNVKNTTGDVKKIDFYIGDIKLVLAQTGSKNFIFNIPQNATLNYQNLSTKVNIDNKEYMGPARPYFQTIEILGVTGGSLSKITGIFTGSCSLIMSNGQSVGINSTSNSKTINMPSIISGDVTGGYINCNGLNSNFVTFSIASPQIHYLKSKDEKSILPGSTVILKGKNFKKTNDDTFKLTVGSDEVTGYNIIDDETIQFDLPKKNIKGFQIKIIKNGFQSNTLTVNSYSYSNVNNVSYEKDSNNNYVIKIMGQFDFNLGDIKGYYGNQTLSIIQTGTNFVSASFPTVTYPTKTTSNGQEFDYANYSCNYYFKPDFVYLSFNGIDSNKFFAKLDLYPTIKDVSQPQCSSDYCEVEFVVDNLLKNQAFRVKLDGQNATVEQALPINSQGSYRIKLYSSNRYLEKGKIEVETDKCLASSPYYFDYSWNLKPKIFSVKSSKFKAGSQFEIVGENFTDALGSNRDDLKVNLSPDITAKNISGTTINFSKQSNSVKGSLGVKIDYKSGDKISVNLSNSFGISNGGVFYMESGSTSYLGVPEINNVSFPDGLFSGKTMIINGVGFSDKCKENQVIWGENIYTPTSCQARRLTLKIPAEPTKSVKIKRGDVNSNDYSFGGDVSGTGYVVNTFEYISSGFNIKKDLIKDTSLELGFGIKNNISNIYVKNIIIDVEGIEYLPISNVYLSIGNDESAYLYNPSNGMFVKTSEKIIGYISKVGDKKYQFIFQNVYIPFSKKDIPIQIKGTLDSHYLDVSDVSFSIGSGDIVYYNVYGEDKISSTKAKGANLGTVNIKGNPLNCFDSDNGKYCSPVVETGSSSTGDSLTGAQSTGDVLTGAQETKYEKYAAMLSDEKILYINNKIGSIINTAYNAHPENKNLQGMIKTYKTILLTTDKVEYIKLLYQYLGWYRDYKKSISE